MIWFLAVMLLLTPAIMVGFGALFARKPPKHINGLYGYRTTRSMKNEQTWDFAHRYIGKLWFRIGLALGVATIPLLIVFSFDEQVMSIFSLVWIAVEMVVLMLPIWPTERALKQHFDKDGNFIA